MKKSIIVSFWDANNINGVNTSWLYHGLTREQAIINFIEQYFKKNYNTESYSDTLPGVYKSNVIKDRLLYDLTDDLVVFAQFA